jgi:integrase
LTEAFVESLPRPPAGKKDYWMRDTRIAGFSVRVYAPDENGEVPKIFGYTIAIDGREKYFRIGRFGIMSASKARGEAQKIDENIRAKKDPYAHRQEVSLATVNDLFEEWKENHWPTGLAASTQECYQRFWDRFIPRTFKYLQLSQVEAKHILEIQKKVTKGGIPYTRRRKIKFVETTSAPSPVQANRVVAMLSGMFKHQFTKRPDQRQGLEHNPCKAVTLDQESEAFVYLERDEQLRLRAFLEAPDNRRKPYSREKEKFAGTALDAIDLIFHTGLRHHEALQLAWNAVNFELGMLSIKVTKYGAKRPRVTRTKHIRITSPARSLLVRLWEGAGRPRNGWVFPGQLDPEKPWYNIQDTWDAIRDLLKLPKGTRLHDMRHTMCTDLLRSGLDRGEVQAYMGWESQESADRYMHVVTKDTHLKAEVIIATRGIVEPNVNGGPKGKPVRSNVNVPAQGMLQDTVDQAQSRDWSP